MKHLDQNKLDKIVNEATKKKYIHGAVFNVSMGDQIENWCGASGNMKIDTPYYIASINKLVISAIILKLIAEGKLSFNDKLTRFFPLKIGRASCRERV